MTNEARMSEIDLDAVFKRQCNQCHGRGKVVVESPAGDWEDTCTTCRGRGVVGGADLDNTTENLKCLKLTKEAKKLANLLKDLHLSDFLDRLSLQLQRNIELQQNNRRLAGLYEGVLRENFELKEKLKQGGEG